MLEGLEGVLGCKRKGSIQQVGGVAVGELEGVGGDGVGRDRSCEC